MFILGFGCGVLAVCFLLLIAHQFGDISQQEQSRRYWLMKQYREGDRS